MKFDELYKKVIDSCKAFEERQVPIRLDFKIEDLRDALVESNDTIEKLKQKLDEKESWVKMLGEGEATLSLELEKTKQKLENAKATAYAESVDAGMRERRLKRALWLARAERAEAEHAHWATIWFCNTKISLNINKSSISQDPYKSNTFRNASEWRNMWYDIASKCLKKAEEHK